MQCFGCGFSLTVSEAPASRRCNACGNHLSFDSDDFLLRGHGAPKRDVREGQVEMGRLVEKVIRENAIAFIEAPVGSGKSDSYGVPAINVVATHGSGFNKGKLTGHLPKMLADSPKVKARVVISTAKKNLQHQIAEKDLPFIRERHGDDEIGIATLKGKSNYACRLKADTALEIGEKVQFYDWASSSKTEDLADFPGKRPSFLNDVTAEDCVGRNCKYAHSTKTAPPICGYWRSKLEAAKARIVVANHSIVAYDLRFGPGVILGPYTTLIIDEAHQAPSSFRSAFSQVVSQGAVHKLIRQIDKTGIVGGYTPAIKNAWASMFAQLTDRDGEIPKNPFGAAGDETLVILSEITKAAGKEAEDLGFSTDEDFDIHHITNEADRTRVLAILSLKKNIERTGQALSEAKEPSDNTVLYVGTNDRKQKKLTLAPVSVGKLVGPKLQMIPSVILTSATLAIGGKFDDAKWQMGLNWPSYSDEEGVQQVPKVIHELVLGTPFNYDKQALLYIPPHMPLPVSDGSPGRIPYIAAVVNECERLIQASDGNAFILFTSNKDLEDVHEGLLAGTLTNTIITQGDDAAAALKQFRATPNSVLLGVKSLWEGVDVQGDKLWLVIITKLPFPHPEDPVLQARSRQLVAEQVAQGVAATTAQSGVFSRLQIPAMLTDLRQGAGRLIRAKADRGVLAVLDPRMFTGNSKDKPMPDQKTLRGYGKLAADATGFNNRIFDFGVIQRAFAYWKTH